MSEAAKFTAGPWVAGRYGNSLIVTAKDGLYDIAVVRDIGNEDNAANAALIAAAPDLLSVAQAQHRALDILMARLIGLDPTFRPTQWEGWQAVVDGSAAITRATTPA